jgi:hypothetical protein
MIEIRQVIVLWLLDLALWVSPNPDRIQLAKAIHDFLLAPPWGDVRGTKPKPPLGSLRTDQ